MILNLQNSSVGYMTLPMVRPLSTPFSWMTLGFVALHGKGFLGVSVVENPPANAGDRFDPWVRKTPWRKKWQPTPVFLPGKSHGQRSLVGYSPWGCIESEATG